MTVEDTDERHVTELLQLRQGAQVDPVKRQNLPVMKLRSTLVIAASVLLLGLPTWAAPTAPVHHGKGRYNKALAELNLNADQQAKIKTIWKTTPKGSRKAAILQVLTPDQQAQFKAKVGKGQHRTHHPKAAKPKWQPGQTQPEGGGNEGPEDD